jgi:uncharacterized protein (DUF1810 family)
MIFPDEALCYVGTFVVLEWNEAIFGSDYKRATNSGGRLLRVDDTYLYLQPFGLSKNLPASKPGEPVTRLGLKPEEEQIPLVDVSTIATAPLDGIPVDDNMQRFLDAQAGVFETALAELRAGRKRSHWMWFVFPQHRGLGRSPTAEYYGIASLDEARAYLSHGVLGPRLIACTEAVLSHDGISLSAIFGSPDDLKFCSSMTLFARASERHDSIFDAAIQRLCGGHADERTIALLDEGRETSA